jgi:hypothetical protein
MERERPVVEELVIHEPYGWEINRVEPGCGTNKYTSADARPQSPAATYLRKIATEPGKAIAAYEPILTSETKLQAV